MLSAGQSRRELRGVAAALMAVLLSGCASSGTCRMTRATSLPLDIEQNHLVASVEVNGLPARMMIDTGANVTVLTREAIARMKLPEPLTSGASVNGLGGSRDLSVLRSARFKLGSMTGSDLDFGVLEGRRVLGSLPVDGIVGMDLLSQIDLDLDLPAHKLILYRALDGCARPSAALDPPLYTIPMVQPLGDVRVMVHVTIAGQRLVALLDTGSPANIFFSRTARVLDLNGAAAATDTSGTVSGIGPRVVHMHRHVIEPMTVGDLTIRNMPAEITGARGSDGEDLILGLDFFSRVHVWMSFSSHTLIMQFPPKPSPG